MGFVTAALAALAVALAPGAVAQTAYNLVIIPTSLTAKGSGAARGINSSGHVLYTPADGAAAIWASTSGGSQTTQVPPLQAGLSISPSGIAWWQSSDIVVGTATIAPITPLSGLPNQFTQAAFVWTPSGGTQDLNTLLGRSDWYFSQAADVSSGGFVVGGGAHLDPVAGTWHGSNYRANLATLEVTEVHAGNTATSVNANGDALLGCATAPSYFVDGTTNAATAMNIQWAWDVNDNRQIAGACYSASYMTACYLPSPGGPIQILGSFASGYSYASGINNAGLVVGAANTSRNMFNNPVYNAFRWKPGDRSLTNLNSFLPKGSAWVLQRAAKVSDSGIIVGEAVNGTAVAAFVLGPK